MGQKNFKGAVTISNDNGRIRLRWGYQSKRYSLNLFQYNRPNHIQAKKIAVQIEQDIICNQFDFSLKKYNPNAEPEPFISKSIVSYFEDWTTSYRQMDCNVHTNYHSLRSMLKKWGYTDQNNILQKLNNETFCAITYNRRLTMLKSFSIWMLKKKYWTVNPLEDVNPKKVKKTFKPKRKPFTVEEIQKVLHAFKHDTCCSKYSHVKHSHYYPFIFFLFKTGVRNAEAIGLRVGSIDIELKQIHIKEVLARTLKHTSASKRIRKETKNGKERILPLTSDLFEVLSPIIKNKKNDDLVFQSPEGLAIDDNNFSTRIFKPVLRELNIEERVLYACRHTFGSRCIDQGINPVMTAFLMGNNPETALRNYTHQINIPKELPKI